MIQERLDFGLNLEQDEAFTITGFFKSYSTENLHTHPFHQILMIKNGISLFEELNQKQPLYGNMVAFIPADLPHRSTVIGNQVQYQNLYFHKNLFKNNPTYIKIYEISELSLALLNRLCKSDFIKLSDNVSGDCLKLFLNLLLEELDYEIKLVRLPVPNSPKNKRIIDYIEKNYDKKLTLPHFQEALPLSTRQITRLFQQDLQITVFEYLRLYRILKASISLCDSGKIGENNIIDIGYDCGYESISSFYQDFKRIFGLSPNAFRKKCLLDR